MPVWTNTDANKGKERYFHISSVSELSYEAASA